MVSKISTLPAPPKTLTDVIVDAYDAERRALIMRLNSVDDVLIKAGRLLKRTIPPKEERAPYRGGENGN